MLPVCAKLLLGRDSIIFIILLILYYFFFLFSALGLFFSLPLGFFISFIVLIQELMLPPCPQSVKARTWSSCASVLELFLCYHQCQQQQPLIPPVTQILLSPPKG